MSVQMGIWRIDGKVTALPATGLDTEDRLEDILADNISIASPKWMIIGRQVTTDYGTIVDLLAIDQDGHLIVIELKRDQTPRDVVAQVLDYGSWVRKLKNEDIVRIFSNYRSKYFQNDPTPLSFDEAFKQKFRTPSLPESLNEQHELVIGASTSDESTERIIQYLSEEYGVSINFIYFSVFKDENREYLSRVWFLDPTLTEAAPERSHDDTWNGEYYCSFGHGTTRDWNDAIQYGFISAGGGKWFTQTLHLLEKGKRVWVNIPGQGYVGVAEVLDSPKRVDQFQTMMPDGSKKNLNALPVKAKDMFVNQSNADLAEYVVAVKWIKTLPFDQAIKETGFFGNQNSICQPTAKRWQHTVSRLKLLFGVE